MKNRNLSPGFLGLLIALLTALLASLWYFGFHAPMERELARIQSQIQQADERLAEAAAKLARMDAMEDALNEANFDPDSDPQTAPFDNKQAVLTELNRILHSTLEYRLDFADPDISENGTVRRMVTMDFRCENFAAGQQILRRLTEGPWLCLIRNLSISGSENILESPVDVRATLIYLEHTRIKP